jgi:hypothetical protein
VVAGGVASSTTAALVDPHATSMGKRAAIPRDMGAG